MISTPSFEQAASAIAGLALGGPAAVKAASGLVGIVTDLFAGHPDQDKLKARYAAVQRETDAALDRLDAAIADAKPKG